MTGESGSGKTTACRQATAAPHAGLYVPMSTGSAMCHETKCRPLLIIDESPHMRSEVLEDLRRLTNFAMDADNRLGLLLVGHPELRREHEALSQSLLSPSMKCTNAKDVPSTTSGSFLASAMATRASNVVRS